MSKIIKKSNYRIVVEPETHVFGIALSEDTIKSNLRDMEQQIKRHVDNIGWMNIEYDTDEICSHCGLTWEESPDDSDPDWPKGTPYCCQKAIDEFNLSKTKQLNQ